MRRLTQQRPAPASQDSLLTPWESAEDELRVTNLQTPKQAKVLYVDLHVRLAKQAQAKARLENFAKILDQHRKRLQRNSHSVTQINQGGIAGAIPSNSPARQVPAASHCSTQGERPNAVSKICQEADKIKHYTNQMSYCHTNQRQIIKTFYRPKPVTKNSLHLQRTKDRAKSENLLSMPHSLNNTFCAASRRKVCQSAGPNAKFSKTVIELKLVKCGGFRSAQKLNAAQYNQPQTRAGTSQTEGSQGPERTSCRR